MPRPMGARAAARGAVAALLAVQAGACANSPRSATPDAPATTTSTTTTSTPPTTTTATTTITSGQVTTPTGTVTTGAVTTTVATDAPGVWRPLFDGQSLAGWRGYRSANAPAGWRVADGAMTKTGVADDVVSAGQFGNFELEFDWRIARGGNAGVFYRATEEYEKVYWSAPEYQLLDDAGNPGGEQRLLAAGAAYGLYPSPAGVVRPAGEWNQARIVANGAHVEHWLNGRKLLEYELGSPEWEAKVKGSKFGEWANFARARRGHIAIQGDHEGDLAIRNVRIRELP